MSALEWYAHKSLGDGIFWIQERFFESGNRANIWLVRGTEQDVVIDTGLGLRSLPEYLYSAGLLQDPDKGEDLVRRPLLAVATHVHFDHAGGLYQFDQVAVHRAEADALARGDNFETATWLSESEVVRAPSPGWNARQFRVQAVQPTHILQEGDVISLGDRQLTVMHMPGHSRGSICLLDKDRKILFSGDVVYDGAMIDWLPYSRINDYIVTCERLIELVDSGVVEKVLPGHFNTFGAERLYRLASNYISKAGLCHKVSTCAMRSLASLALRVTTSRTPS
ncbi:acyl-coenzyme A thioesterase MBLAC2 [Monodelphis domestica]|uniref:Metallo-beta-lactamase domain containing 2 n=2 Tax=Metatheria TaxID=9263 RepID=F7FXJ0_MONDO|nr:acyl-coenzyme A thioesterase MBLAC2 [Monodelphis domestica]XP_027720051.1 metallo-beta-lactamase domain-containing protein 2 [Vombatus ursinus]XP_036597646.1 metallo-beta-lactamase domain-containing protein 2 [Trichosurus vulpecula]XP_043824956.1 metallo-beta-lactamase domain-containing protein 2 [Dromiciops gliroides]XP_044513591.1 metallo-beta-lactamase domain-containing protein 2 [Gracilinanus agilis]XP_051849457.1 acyl-coenzyme A thioesterase MBLAC2 [Antechinus flavipes]